MQLGTRAGGSELRYPSSALQRADQQLDPRVRRAGRSYTYSLAAFGTACAAGVVPFGAACAEGRRCDCYSRRGV